MTTYKQSGEPPRWRIESASPQAAAQHIAALAIALNQKHQLPGIIEGFSVVCKEEQYPARYRRDDARPVDEWEVEDWYSGHQITLSRGELNIIIDDKGPMGGNCVVRVVDQHESYEVPNGTEHKADPFELVLDDTLNRIAERLEHARREAAVRAEADKTEPFRREIPEKERETRQRLLKLLQGNA